MLFRWVPDAQVSEFRRWPTKPLVADFGHLVHTHQPPPPTSPGPAAAAAAPPSWSVPSSGFWPARRRRSHVTTPGVVEHVRRNQLRKIYLEEAATCGIDLEFAPDRLCGVPRPCRLMDPWRARRQPGSHDERSGGAPRYGRAAPVSRRVFRLESTAGQPCEIACRTLLAGKKPSWMTVSFTTPCPTPSMSKATFERGSARQS